jgi:hypothetical protein
LFFCWAAHGPVILKFLHSGNGKCVVWHQSRIRNHMQTQVKRNRKIEIRHCGIDERDLDSVINVISELEIKSDLAPITHGYDRDSCQTFWEFFGWKFR